MWAQIGPKHPQQITAGIVSCRHLIGRHGLWLLLTDWVGHTEQFDGWFDNVMSFFFYIPNLIIVELMIRARDRSKNVRIRNVASASMILASVVLVIATWGFARVAWIPAITEWAVG